MERLFLLLFPLATLVSLSPAHADDATEMMRSARERFVEAESAFTDVVADSLEEAEARARRRGNRDELKEIAETRSEFRLTGTVPATVPRLAIRRFQLAKNRLKSDYSKVIRRLTQEGRDSDATLAEQELQSLLEPPAMRPGLAKFTIVGFIADGTVNKGSPIFTNQDWRFGSTPPPYRGWHFSQHQHGKPPAYRLKVETPGAVYMASLARSSEDREKLIADAKSKGWQEMPEYITDNDPNFAWIVFRRDFEKGSFKIPVWKKLAGTLVLSPRPLVASE